MKSIAAAVLSVIFALSSFVYMVSLPNENTAKCLADPYQFADYLPYYNLIFPAQLDGFMCATIDFFNGAAFRTGSVGRIIYGYVNSVLIATSVFSGIEGGRRSAKGFVYLYAAMNFLSLFITIGAAFPFLWLSSWFLSNKSKSKSDEYLSENYVFMTGTCAAINMLLMIATQFAPIEFNSWVIVCLFVSLLLPLIANLYLLIFGYSKTIEQAERGHNQALLFYYFFSGVCFMYWIYMGFLLWINFAEISNQQILHEFLFENPYSAFLYVDGSSVILSFLFFIFMETGVAAIVKMNMYSILIGPGAAILLYCADRESQIMKGLKSSTKQKLQ
jgi:hypothetical protein